LVLLNYDTNQAIQLLFALKKCDSTIQFLIKLHPDQCLDEIKRSLNSIPLNFKFISESIDQLLNKVSMIIHNGGIAIFECVNFGIPFVNYITNSLPFEALSLVFPEQKDISESDLYDIRNTFQSQTIKNNIEYFEDVHFCNWQKILDE
jgi:spore coat polysaccharide biosynthesis predicted glycosyltransferase SpsG